jgi:hypothetical protein
MLQNPYFTAPNPHMTSHQFNKIAKKQNKLTHTMRNTQRKENRQTTPTKETTGQTKPTADRGSGPTLAVGLARPTPAVGLDPRWSWVWPDRRRQWVWYHTGSGSGQTRLRTRQNPPQNSILMLHKSFLMPQNPFLMLKIRFLMPQNLFLKSNLKPKRKKLTLRDLIT